MNASEREEGSGDSGGFVLDRDDPRCGKTLKTPVQLIVVQELEHALAPYFDGRAELRPALHGETLGLPGKRSDGQRFELVAWRFEGVHTGSLNGLPPTKRTASILGMTVALLPEGMSDDVNEVSDDQVAATRLLRELDWLSVFTQLGFPVFTRPLAQ